MGGEPEGRELKIMNCRTWEVRRMDIMLLLKLRE